MTEKAEMSGAGEIVGVSVREIGSPINLANGNTYMLYDMAPDVC
jgi:hypothetical protein